MTTPVQPAAALPTSAQPAATNSKQSTEWQQFYDWFAYGILPGSGSTPSSSQPAAAATTPKPAAAPPASPSAPSAPAQPTPPATSTADLWETSVTGTGPYGGTWNYNPLQFATPQTAEQMAQIVGGQVQADTLGLYTTSSPILEITGAGDNPLNAGLVADLFQKYGDQQGSYAWTVIDRDLGKTQG